MRFVSIIYLGLSAFTTVQATEHGNNGECGGIADCVSGVCQGWTGSNPGPSSTGSRCVGSGNRGDACLLIKSTSCKAGLTCKASREGGRYQWEMSIEDMMVEATLGITALHLYTSMKSSTLVIWQESWSLKASNSHSSSIHHEDKAFNARVTPSRFVKSTLSGKGDLELFTIRSKPKSLKPKRILSPSKSLYAEDA
ncbi:uncharacterized protein RCO7_11192 [Rhynchosporium graminicola]|uniref:Uncharacterized protein n=1 Tax=Rhynchosporium graminicola TaxID=2792576 RepID=A0A1E1K4X6_9HELO|nr:uncharacterized protein RCO7_11192 [Rhynchosporium commune]